MNGLAQQRLKADAANRAQRTLIGSLYVDLGVVVALFIVTNIDSIDLSSADAAAAVGLSFAKSVLVAVASYVIRMYGDKSRIYTGPLPPEDPGPPAEEVDPPHTADEVPREEHHYVVPSADSAAEANERLIGADAQVRLVQAQVDLAEAQEGRRESARQIVAAAAKKAPTKRAPGKAPVKKAAPTEPVTKAPRVAKKSPTSRKKPSS